MNFLVTEKSHRMANGMKVKKNPTRHNKIIKDRDLSATTLMSAGHSKDDG